MSILSRFFCFIGLKLKHWKLLIFSKKPGKILANTVDLIGAIIKSNFHHNLHNISSILNFIANVMYTEPD